ncbi:MAG: hypothetical protein ACI8W8_001593 [Rhodothermales bacterium]|jgi:hypothetical protein
MKLGFVGMMIGLLAATMQAQEDWQATLSRIYLDAANFENQPVSAVLAELATHTDGKPQLRYLRSNSAREPRVTVKLELTSVYAVLEEAALQSGRYMQEAKDRITLQHRSSVTRNRLQAIILPRSTSETHRYLKWGRS